MCSGWSVSTLWFFILFLLAWDFFLTYFPCISIDVCFKSNFKKLKYPFFFFLSVNKSQFYFYSTNITCEEEVITDQYITALATQTKPSPWSTSWGNCSVFSQKCWIILITFMLQWAKWFSCYKCYRRCKLVYTRLLSVHLDFTI